MVKSENTTVCVTLPNSSVDLIDFYCSRSGLKRSSLINLAVVEFMNRRYPGDILNLDDFLRFVGKKPE